ncbi:MAG TPA: DUF1328 family protein, partial [Amaricoccus sp.]|nr:DUF1328 family protein [Amaricoccus sp.]
VLGFGGIAGAAVSIAKIIFFIAIVLFAISIVAHLVRGRPEPGSAIARSSLRWSPRPARGETDSRSAEALRQVAHALGLTFAVPAPDHALGPAGGIPWRASPI